VAAYNSIDAGSADYICDGTDDQVEINTAINNLPAGGGSIYLKEGTYILGDQISISQSNVCLVGTGAGTVLKIKDGKDADMNVIYASGQGNLLVEDLRIDGNKVNQTAGSMYGIYFTGVDNSKIVDCWVENLSLCGIYLDVSSNDNTVTGNTCQENNYYGIYLGNSSNSSNNNTVTGNTCQGNDLGIFLDGSSNNTVTGNTCQGNDSEGISLGESSNNTVSLNIVMSNSQSANNTYDGIYIYNEGDYNSIQGNTVRRGTGANQQRYGIRIDTADCDGNLVINNDLYLAGATADYSDAGTGTEYHNNRTTAGWVP
jgi:parallel beta-helix repeat protein